MIRWGTRVGRGQLTMPWSKGKLEQQWTVTSISGMISLQVPPPAVYRLRKGTACHRAGPGRTVLSASSAPAAAGAARVRAGALHPSSLGLTTPSHHSESAFRVTHSESACDGASRASWQVGQADSEAEARVYSYKGRPPTDEPPTVRPPLLFESRLWPPTRKVEMRKVENGQVVQVTGAWGGQVDIDVDARAKPVLDAAFHSAGGAAPKEDWFWLRVTGCRPGPNPPARSLCVTSLRPLVSRVPSGLHGSAAVARGAVVYTGWRAARGQPGACRGSHTCPLTPLTPPPAAPECRRTPTAASSGSSTSVTWSVTVRYRPLPSATVRYRPLPSVTVLYLPLPSVTVHYRALPSISWPFMPVMSSAVTPRHSILMLTNC
jgi:hypothetical protein